MRIGAKKRPFYRVVAVDERAKRNGAYIELLGTYNPLTHPHEVILKKDRIEHWLKQGAVKSDGFLRIIGEAPQRPPRKAKKQKKEVASSEEQVVSETPVETPSEEPQPAQETPQEASAEVQAEETTTPIAEETVATEEAQPEVPAEEPTPTEEK